MKKIVICSLILTLVFSISVLLHMPARHVVSYLLYSEGKPIYPELTVLGVVGNVWQGEAESLLWKQHQLGKLTWQLQLSEIIKGKLEYKLNFGDHHQLLDTNQASSDRVSTDQVSNKQLSNKQLGNIQLQNSQLSSLGWGEVGISLWGSYLENTSVTVPASSLFNDVLKENLGLPITFTGNIELAVEQLTLSEHFCFSAKQTANQSEQIPDTKPFATLAWHSGVVDTLYGQLNINGIIGQLKCENNRLNLLSNYQSNQLELNGNISLGAKKEYLVKGWLKAKHEFPEQMRQQLHWLGEEDNQGRYHIDFEGHWQ